MFEIDAKIHILIVSADPDVTLNCKLIIKKSGLSNVTSVESGIEALKLCESQRFEVIFCNQKTKHLSGWLFVQEVKNSPKIANNVMILVGSNPSTSANKFLRMFV